MAERTERFEKQEFKAGKKGVRDEGAPRVMREMIRSFALFSHRKITKFCAHYHMLMLAGPSVGTLQNIGRSSGRD